MWYNCSNGNALGSVCSSHCPGEGVSFSFFFWPVCFTQLLDEVFVISGIIKVEVAETETDNTYQDLDYSGS